MTLQEILEQKKVAEAKIVEAIDEFTKKTSLHVTEITLNCTSGYGDMRPILLPNLIVTL